MSKNSDFKNDINLEYKKVQLIQESKSNSKSKINEAFTDFDDKDDVEFHKLYNPNWKYANIYDFENEVKFPINDKEFNLLLDDIIDVLKKMDSRQLVQTFHEIQSII